MEILEKLFGGSAKIKIMRLFLFSQKSAYGLDEVVVRSKVPSAQAKKEIIALERIGLLQSKNIHIEANFEEENIQAFADVDAIERVIGLSFGLFAK